VLFRRVLAQIPGYFFLLDFRLLDVLRLPDDRLVLPPPVFRRPLFLLPELRLLVLCLPPEDLRLLFVWPAFRRSLLTVRAAISSARSLLMPRFFPDSLMCLY
jgi:hypothetical protein